MGMHEDQPLLQEGPELRDARGLLILLHGADSTARAAMDLAPQFAHEGLAFAAPQADGQNWFPYSCLVPVQQNEPGIPSALTIIRSLVMEADLLGVPRRKVMILGFSQGACLALEFAARNPERYGGIFALSGGLTASGAHLPMLAGVYNTQILVSLWCHSSICFVRYWMYASLSAM